MKALVKKAKIHIKDGRVLHKLAKQEKERSTSRLQLLLVAKYI
jgi:hypothetical protein